MFLRFLFESRCCCSLGGWLAWTVAQERYERIQSVDENEECWFVGEGIRVGRTFPRTLFLHLLGRNSTGLGRNQSVQSQSRDTKHHHQQQQQRKTPLAQGCCCCFSRQRVVLLFLWLVCVSPAVRAPTFHLKDEASFGCCVMDDTNTKLLSVDSIPFIQRSSNKTTRFWTYALVRVVLLESLEVVAEQKGFHGGGDGDKTEKSSENGFGSRS